MAYPSDVIRILRDEIGYHEKATNADLDSKTANSGANNWTKYSRDLDAIHYFNTPKNGPKGEWCAIIQSWAHVKLYKDARTARASLYQPDDPKYNCGAGCVNQAQYFRENNAFFTYPQVGDMIFFGSAGDESHTGRVVEVTDRNVITIEGNEANEVRVCRYSIDDPKIVGYGRPRFESGDPYVCHVVVTGDTLDKISEEYDTTADAIAKENGIKDKNFITSGTVLIFKKGDKTWHTSDIFCQYGDRNKAVSVIQALLLKRGLSLTYDGYFGAETRSAVMTWQRSKGITVDGIVGDETIATL